MAHIEREDKGLIRACCLMVARLVARRAAQALCCRPDTAHKHLNSWAGVKPAAVAEALALRECNTANLVWRREGVADELLRLSATIGIVLLRAVLGTDSRGNAVHNDGDVMVASTCWCHDRGNWLARWRDVALDAAGTVAQLADEDICTVVRWEDIGSVGAAVIVLAVDHHTILDSLTVVFETNPRVFWLGVAVVPAGLVWPDGTITVTIACTLAVSGAGNTHTQQE